MKRPPLTRLTALALSLGLPLACESGSDEGRDDTAGTDVGNPVVLALRAWAPEARVVDGAGAAYRLERAEGQVSEVELVLAEGSRCAGLGALPGGVRCDAARGRVSIEGSLRADLVAGTLAPAVRVPAGDFARVELRPGPSAQAVGLRLVLIGEDGRRYQVTLETEGRLSFLPGEGGEGAALFQADPSAWVGAVDLAACAAASPGQGSAPLVVDPVSGDCEGRTLRRGPGR